MALLSLIAAIDESRGLGFNNQLLCHLPADLQHFKTLTMGKPIIMGRKTFESIGKPLPGRLNIILSHRLPATPGIVCVDSLEKALAIVAKEPEVMIIGGANLYSQAIGIANCLYITQIHHQFQADVFFPDIKECEWRLSCQKFRKHDDKNKYDMTFVTYEKM